MSHNCHISVKPGELNPVPCNPCMHCKSPGSATEEWTICSLLEGCVQQAASHGHQLLCAVVIGWFCCVYPHCDHLLVINNAAMIFYDIGCCLGKILLEMGCIKCRQACRSRLPRCACAYTCTYIWFFRSRCISSDPDVCTITHANQYNTYVCILYKFAWCHYDATADQSKVDEVRLIT